MKKLISGISALLTAAMLIAPMSAFADTTINPKGGTPFDVSPDPDKANTSVEFSVDPAYTVTIPEKVVLEKDTATGTYTKTDSIKAESVFLHETERIIVTLTSNSGFKMSHEDEGTYKLPYKAIVGGSEIASGGKVAEFSTSTDEQTADITFTADNPQYAGKYSDTVVFNVSVVKPT